MTITEQGVAGRLIAEIRTSYQNAETDDVAQAHGNQMAGVVILHDELSREARAILAEYQELPYKHLVDDEKNQVGVEYVREAFARLGLALESEEAE